MKTNNDSRFLSHLEGCVPDTAHNYMLSTYSIILEAWRRGLEVDIQIVKEKDGKIEPYFTLSHKKKKHQFSVTRGDKVSMEAKNISKNKHTAKEFLLKAGVSAPKGDVFEENKDSSDILEYAEKLGYPLVLKPLAGTGGRGVIANIQNDKEMQQAIKYVREDLNYKNLIIEQFIEGEDHRLYVVGDEVVGVFKRDPASITGNGKDTIAKLLEKKNEERSKIPSVKNNPIKVTGETKELLNRLGYSMKSTPKDGEVVFLKSKSNVSSGGEAVDVTDSTSDKIKQIAVDATKAIPSLVQGGVDMIVDKENNTGVVLEINTRAHIRTHLYPSYGKARDIPTALIDYYFPETKGYDREEPNKLYIDYDFIFNASLSRDAASIKLPRIPASSIDLKRFIITGTVYDKKFALRVRRLAYNNKINGYIKPMKNSNIIVVAGGGQKNVNDFYNELTRYLSRNFKVSTIVEKKRTTPIAHGFKVIGLNDGHQDDKVSENFIEKYSNLQNDYKRLIRKLSEYEKQERVLELTERQNQQLKKRVSHYENSTSWKITKPIRSLGRLRK